MFVNRLSFLVSVARGLSLVTAEFTRSRTAKQLAAGITQMIDLYARGGFQVGTVLMDNEFEKLRNLVPSRMQDQVDQGTGKGHPKYPSVQENSQAHADRASLTHGVVAERIPCKLRSVRDTIPTQKLFTDTS
jgi:D-aminopeptidase